MSREKYHSHHQHHAHHHNGQGHHHQASSTAAQHQHAGGGLIGDGECTTLVKHFTGLGAASGWKEGQKLKDFPNLAPGTPIATFHNGQYHGHAAIFQGWVKNAQGQIEGARVFDQWNGLHTSNHVPHPAQERTLHFNGSALNDPRFFSVISGGHRADVSEYQGHPVAFDTPPPSAPGAGHIRGRFS